MGAIVSNTSATAETVVERQQEPTTSTLVLVYQMGKVGIKSQLRPRN
jgi:hypothetical protein